MESPSSPSKTSCVSCGNKAVGIFRCEGCLNVFCRKHLNEHRHFLSNQLDEIVLEHDTLQQTIIENQSKQNNQHSAVKEIDRWEKDSIMKIQQLAEEARQQVKNSTSSQTVSEELHDLSERLKKARIDDDYVETDLRTWTTMLQKLKDDMNLYVPSISIKEDPTQTIVSRIYVSTTNQSSREIEKFGEFFGNICVDNNGCLATHCGSDDGTALVRGEGEYSSGKHSIRFLFRKKSTTFTTWFDVVSKLNPIWRKTANVGAYGWSSDDSIHSANVRMTVDNNYRDMNGQTTFEIELQLDCDNQKISYVNQGTKKRREMYVDITKCPFPWQIRFCLYEVGDYVQFLL